MNGPIARVGIAAPAGVPYNPTPGVAVPAGLAQGAAPGVAAPGELADGGGGWSPAGWPSHSQLTYVKEAITVLLLLLALPWLAGKLLTRPGEVFAGAAGKHLSPPRAAS